MLRLADTAPLLLRPCLALPIDPAAAPKLNHQIARERCGVLVGPGGAGKSTLAQSLASVADVVMIRDLGKLRLGREPGTWSFTSRPADAPAK